MSTVCVLVVENAGCLLLPLYFVEAMEFSLVETSHLLIVLAVAALVSSPPVGWCVDRYGARAMSMVGAVAFCGATGRHGHLPSPDFHGVYCRGPGGVRDRAQPVQRPPS